MNSIIVIVKCWYFIISLLLIVGVVIHILNTFLRIQGVDKFVFITFWHLLGISIFCKELGVFYCLLLSQDVITCQLCLDLFGESLGCVDLLLGCMLVVLVAIIVSDPFTSGFKDRAVGFSITNKRPFFLTDEGVGFGLILNCLNFNLVYDLGRYGFLLLW